MAVKFVVSKLQRISDILNNELPCYDGQSAPLPIFQVSRLTRREFRVLILFLMCFDTCTTAPETHRCPPLNVPIRLRCRLIVLSSGVQRWGSGVAVIPWSLLHGPIGHCVSPVALPLYSPPSAFLQRFGCATAGCVDRLQAAMGSWHGPGTASGAGRRSPPLAPPPAIQLRSSW